MQESFIHTMSPSRTRSSRHRRVPSRKTVREHQDDSEDDRPRDFSYHPRPGILDDPEDDLLDVAVEPDRRLFSEFFSQHLERAPADPVRGMKGDRRPLFFKADGIA